MQALKIPVNKSVQISAVRARGEVSGFQIYYNDHTTDGWSPIGPRNFVGEGFWSPLLSGDARLAAKPYEWYMGIDLITITGSGGIASTIEIDAPANKTTVHIFEAGNENTTVVFSFA